ncbi:uncharacterized protein LOC128896523 isoform X2 [Hylaeus anthracinus]|uniref:uncharacterized protein LOC128896523 isoform X2 n=1 Tax=Hylaeus anthracinus TaxID=313031 RepID=UPI0023B9131D|nr:uncharacterized protein LOC128896523 isoform X2 [Hylaeus anthracinus]
MGFKSTVLMKNASNNASNLSPLQPNDKEDNVISIPSFNNASNLSPSQADHEQDHNRIDTDNEASDDENDPTYEMSEESESSADEPNNDRS